MIPTRADPSFISAKSDDELFKALSRHGGIALVGLKSVEKPRGLWKGRRLITEEEENTARDRVQSVEGIVDASDSIEQKRPIGIDGLPLPYAVVRVLAVEGLHQLRVLPDVDFVEPYYIDFMDGGCTDNFLDQNPIGGPAYTCNAPMPCLTYPNTTLSDLVPWNYDSGLTNIVSMWTKRGATGRDATAAILDTGVFQDQWQLYHSEFNSEPSGRTQGGQFDTAAWPTRTALHYSIMSSIYGGFDTCNHGTRIAGTIAAPLDNASVVGVAHEANLETYLISNAVVDVGVPQWAILNAIGQAAKVGPTEKGRVVEMAFGTLDSLNAISDAIDMAIAVSGPGKAPKVLFVAAADTFPGVPAVWPYPPVIFPASLPSVMAVSTADLNGGVVNEASYGGAVDVTVPLPPGFEIPTTGRRSMGTFDDIVSLGATSGASAIVAGVAADVWSVLPAGLDNAEEVRKRIERTAANARANFLDPNTGNGNIDAYAAAGGLTEVSISGPIKATAHATFKLTADLGLAICPNATYAWQALSGGTISGSSTTKSITVTAGNDGTSGSFRVTVNCNYYNGGSQDLTVRTAMKNVTFGIRKCTTGEEFACDHGNPLACNDCIRGWMP